MRRIWLLLVLCGVSGKGAALQVQTLEVSRDESVYHLLVDVRIEASPERVCAQLLDVNATTLVVAGSCSKSGVAYWQLTSQGRGTRRLFTADTEPDFWLPPFVGPRAVLKAGARKNLSLAASAGASDV